MPPDKPRTLGAVPWGYRSQVGAFEWGGCYPDGDASSIPPNMFRSLVNVRRRGGGIEMRGGEEAVNESALWSGAKVVGGYDWNQDFEPYVFLRCYFCSGTPHGAIIRIKTSFTDYMQTIVTNTPEELTAALFNGNLYVSMNNALLGFTSPEAVGSGAVPTSASDFRYFKLINTFTGWDRISWMGEYSGYLMIALTGTGSTKVVAYDGTTFTDDLTGLGVGIIVTGGSPWRDKLVIGFDGTPNSIRVRSSGTPPGSWATVAPGAGTVKFHNTGVSLGANLYWPALTDANIWSYDGTTVAIAHTIAVAGTPLARGVTRLGNIMYFINGPATGNSTLGMTDGTTWTDSQKTFTSLQAMALGQQNGDLLVALYDSSAGLASLQRSPGSDSKGTWSTINLTNLLPAQIIGGV